MADPDQLYDDTFGAKASAIAAIDDDPEKAAESIRLGAATGTPSVLVHADQENFLRQQKVAASAAIVESNEYIQKYLKSHPLAAQVSNDDLANLDTISQKVGMIGTKSILSHAMEGFKEGFSSGFGEGGLGAWIPLEDIQRYRLGAAAASVLGAPIEGFVRIGSGLLAGGVGAVSAGAVEAYKQLGGNEAEANRLGRDITAAGQVLPFHEVSPLILPAGAAAHVNRFAKLNRIKITPKGVDDILPYIKAGEAPPKGVSEIVDTLHEAQAHLDIKNLAEAYADSQTSETLKRAPEFYKKFLEGIDNGSIGIDSEGVRKLYGDKQPTPDDNILGWVPNIAQQLDATATTGGDIEIPIKDLLTKIDKDVFRELKDYIRTREDGITIEEAKQKAAPAPSVTLKPEKKSQENDFVYHKFAINDSEGKKLGVLELNQTEEGSLDVEWIGPEDLREKLGKPEAIDALAQAKNTLGTKAVRDVLQQLRTMFPDAKTIGGYRVSGSRAVANDEVSMLLHNERKAAGLEPILQAEEPPKPPGTEPPTEPPKPIEPEGEKKPFTAQALRIPKTTLARYERLIARRDSEDVAAAERRLLAEETRRQSKEWRENEAALRPEAENAVVNTPVVRANTFLQGLAFDPSHPAPALDAAKVPGWAAEVLPKKFLSKKGLDPDVAGDMFGYNSGADMIRDLARFHKERDNLGKTQGEYQKILVDRELDRRMKNEYGSLGDTILQEAREQIVSPTQMDLLHEDTLALGQAAGVEFTMTKDDVRNMVRQFFDGRVASKQSLKKALQESGRAGRALEDALLKGDTKEAFRQKQRQTYIMAAAEEIKRLDQEKKRFDRLAKGLSAREPNGLNPEWTNFIHSVMVRVGLPVDRLVQDIATEINAGLENNLKDFLDRRERLYSRTFDVPDYLLNEGWSKPINEMTVAEYRDITRAITTMAKQARDEQTVYIQGQKFDKDKFIQGMIERLKDVAGGKVQVTPASETLKSRIGYNLKTAGVSALQLEAVFNRIDRGDFKGAFNQLLIPIIEAQNSLAKLQRKYSREIAENADNADLDKRVDNLLITDPMTWEIGPDGKEIPGTGQPIAMTKRHVRAILQHVGSESGFEKITRGYSVNPDSFKAWLYLNAEHDDWVFAAKQGEMFARLKDEIDQMYRELTGIAPEDIQLRPIDVKTPKGEVFQHEGWYSPLIYHDKWEFGLKGEDAEGVMDSKYGFRATTFAGHTKRRPTYAAPLSLDLNDTIMRLGQMLNDLAMRPAIVEASKVFYDPTFRKAMAKYMGKHYEEMLIPYLRDIAATGYYRSDLEKVGATQLEFYRRNAMATLVGLNPGTILKHGPTAWVNSMTEVGAKNFLKAVVDVFKRDEVTGERNYRFAMDSSEELQRRRQHWYESIQGVQERLGPATLREEIMRLASTPLAMSDLASAVPTWHAAYEKAMKDGEAHGDAVTFADRAVRRAHGSSAVTSKPGIMRGSPLSRWFTSFYVFFNHIVNRQYEMVWRSAEARRMVKEGDMPDGMREAARVAGPMLFSYIIFPALLEEIISPLTNDEHESWGKWAAKSLAKDVTASWIGARDLADAMLTGRDPHIGLLESAVQPLTNMVRDITKPRPLDREHAGKFLKDGATFIGMATGTVPAQVGRTSQFIYNYGTGQERPKGIWPLKMQGWRPILDRQSWPVGLWKGTSKEPGK